MSGENLRLHIQIMQTLHRKVLTGTWTCCPLHHHPAPIQSQVKYFSDTLRPYRSKNNNSKRVTWQQKWLTNLHNTLVAMCSVIVVNYRTRKYKHLNPAVFLFFYTEKDLIYIFILLYNKLKSCVQLCAGVIDAQNLKIIIINK